MSARSVLLTKLQNVLERRTRVQADLAAVNAEIAALQALRDTLSGPEETRIADLVRAGVLKVEE